MNSKKAFTLIELLIATMLAGVVILGMITFLLSVKKTQAVTDERIISFNYARGTVEDFRRYVTESIYLSEFQDEAGNYFLKDTAGQPRAVALPDDCVLEDAERLIDIQDVYRSDKPQELAYKKVTVELKWK